MASLNWVQLSVTGRPIPLPTEEPLLSPLKSIELSLYAIPSSIHSTSSATTSAILSRPAILSTSGTLFVSTTRLVFVRSGASPNNINGEDSIESSSLQNGSASIVLPGPSSTSSSAASGGSSSRIPTRMAVLNTLSIPFTHFVEGKYMQPFFGKPYYQAKIIPIIGGGIDAPHLVKIAFKESGGFAFYEAVESMKSRVLESFDARAITSDTVDTLPLYEPPAPFGPATQPIATTTTGNRSRADTFQYDQDAIQLLPLNNVNPLQPRPAERAPDYYGEER